MHLIVTLIIGGVVGWLASIVMKTNAQMGLFANIVVGIVGSLLGFWLAGFIGLSSSSVIASWLIAVAGAVVLIAILKGMKVLK
ncbi:MAG TPA: GlsB/YeaQ/YmgE family stress response membrane protein [Gemmatimonadales bacterium]|nr:GlsB/YeaQ/YmgE family stress response membrane protein [Gemmatimonadales bacterium]